MAVLARVISLVRDVMQRSRIERDLDEELRATLDQLAAEKTRAVRAALRAQRSAIVRLVRRQALPLTAGGVGLGIALGAIAGQVLSALLIGVSSLDPVALTGAAGVCIAVAVVASWVPVHRAMRVAASDALTE